MKTDHQSLEFLLEQRIAIPTQQKWLAKLLGYAFVVEYKKGVDNKVANAFSRKSDLVPKDLQLPLLVENKLFVPSLSS